MPHLQRDNPSTLRSAVDRRSGPRDLGPWAWFVRIGLGIFGLALLFGPSSQPLGKKLATAGVREARAAAPLIRADCPASPAPLQRELAAIAGGFDGKVGIAVTRAGCDWVAGTRVSDFFPQQSVSKLWVALGVMEAVDKGKIGLDQQLNIRPADLTVFHQPLRGEVLENGSVTRSVHELLSAALSHSDNTANDKLLWTVGGPGDVRAMFRRKEIRDIRFGPGERLLQSRTAGLQWSQQLSIGRNFEQARARLPLDQRKEALDRYLADPMDGAQPAGIARALSRLASGQLLSPQSTAVMMEILSKTHSGPRRLKAGAPEGWRVYHKTGTGQELGRLATGYNDVAILQAPDGTYYSVAVMIAQTTQPIPVRMDMMQKVTRAVADFHDELQQSEAGSRAL